MSTFINEILANPQAVSTKKLNVEGLKETDAAPVERVEVILPDEKGDSNRDDTLNGGINDDFLKGGGRNDTLRGGICDDTLIDAAGSDLLNGGRGDDNFMFGEGDVHDMEYGGRDGGWTDTIMLSGDNGDLGEFDVDWTLQLESGSIESPFEDAQSLSDDAAGMITLGDGSTIDFYDIERIEF